MLIRQVVPGKFAKPQQPAILRNRIKSHARAELLEKLVVRARHRLRQVHIFAAADSQHRVGRDHIFLQRRERDGRLDGRAWNVAVTERKFLIDDRQDAAGVRIHRNDRAVVPP